MHYYSRKLGEKVKIGFSVVVYKQWLGEKWEYYQMKNSGGMIAKKNQCAILAI